MQSPFESFKWTEKEQTAFDTIKRIMSKETLLAYPDFTKPFDIHTDASNTQLGAVISQEGQRIAFYSRKLNPAQTRYTTTEQELLAIVETLKEFCNILLVPISGWSGSGPKNSNTMMRHKLTVTPFVD